jgi:acetyltransferase-like isoleucine patch superfamily enzyme
VAEGEALGIGMRALEYFMVKVRRKETPFYARVYEWAHLFRSIHMPVIPGLHHALYAERRLRRAIWGTVLRVAYYEPLFKTRCERVGKNLRLIGGLPLLMGNPIRLIVEDNVTLSGVTTFVGTKLIDDPLLEIGSDSYIGYQTTIVTGRGIHIGRHVLIANRVFIAGDDSHPLDPTARMRNAPPLLRDIKSVWIEDGAWIGDNATVLKGVRVGKAAVVSAHAVVTKDVPPYTVVAGNPAKVIKQLDMSGTKWSRPSEVSMAGVVE